MSRVPALARRASARSPWGALVFWGPRVARWVMERWNRLETHEKDEFVRLARASRGRPNNLSARDRTELTRLFRKMGQQHARRLPGL